MPYAVNRITYAKCTLHTKQHSTTAGHALENVDVSIARHLQGCESITKQPSRTPDTDLTCSRVGAS
jgi:hypothetical protein